MPITSDAVARQFDQRMAERRRLRPLSFAGDRGDHRRSRQARLAGGVCGGRASCRPPCFERLQRELPLVRIDADEVIVLACFEERHALAHQRVARR